jgi:spore coat polysaccharide biosynthesis protein SpsF (cytidylyltransferase family)
LPASESLSDTVLDNINKSTKIDSYILLIAKYGDYERVEDWAIKNSIEYIIGDEDSVIDRINRALIKFEADVLVRLMLRACWVDYELVDLTISELIQTKSDYVEYGLNINYAMGADCFTKNAYLKAAEHILNLEDTIKQSTYKLNPWAMFENHNIF